jgi:predicted metal-dependent peptidase
VLIDTSGSITPADIDLARAAGTLLARIADVTFYGCDDYPTRYGKYLPDAIVGGGGTDLRNGIAMAAREGARAVVVITDCITPWPSNADLAAMGITLIVGANAGSPNYNIPGNRNGYYAPPSDATIIPVVDWDAASEAQGREY